MVVYEIISLRIIDKSVNKRTVRGTTQVFYYIENNMILNNRFIKVLHLNVRENRM